MPDFIVRSRKTSPITDATVNATSRERAIQQTLDTAAEGESIEVMNVQELPSTGPTGTTGTTGTTGATGR
jgi:hypothetical protein